jgi:hypothetical protein
MYEILNMIVVFENDGKLKNEMKFKNRKNENEY